MAICIAAFLLLDYYTSSNQLRPCNRIKQQNTLPPRLIVVSLDGFRFDYTSTYNTLNLNILSSHGVFMPEGVIPVFPTTTSPNHHSMMTGMYPESHGIVANAMYDPDFNATFTIGNVENRWWNQTEPVWISARRQGLRTAVLCWPGANVEYNGIRPNYVVDYSQCGSYEDRIKTVLRWLINGRVNFVALYFGQPDIVGHQFGPINPSVGRIVRQMDDIIGHLLLKLLHCGLLDSTDLIITTDHGMAGRRNDPDGALLLSNYLDQRDFKVLFEVWNKYVALNVFRYYNQGPMASIRPTTGKENIVYNAIKHAHPHVNVYRKDEIPEQYHYKAHRRIPPIIAIADEGYGITMDKLSWLMSGMGKHGYGTEVPSMRGLFIAQGPSFNTGRQIESFEILYVYSLICSVLKIEPNVYANSSLTVVREVFKNGLMTTEK